MMKNSFSDEGVCADGQVGERLAEARTLQTRLTEGLAAADLYARREDIFGVSGSGCPALAAVRRRLEPVLAIWEAAAELEENMPKWMDGALSGLNPDSITADCERWCALP